MQDKKTVPERIPQLDIEDILRGEGAREVGKAPEREMTKEQVEQKPPAERAPEVPESEDQQQTRKPVPLPVQPALEPSPIEKSEGLIEIESILSEGLEELYMELPPEQQLEFQKKGEETAAEVYTLLQQAKVQVSKVLMSIREWLKMIPGVNKFFLEREAKIKTDRVLALRNKQD